MDAPHRMIEKIFLLNSFTTPALVMISVIVLFAFSTVFRMYTPTVMLLSKYNPNCLIYSWLYLFVPFIVTLIVFVFLSVTRMTAFIFGSAGLSFPFFIYHVISFIVFSVRSSVLSSSLMLIKTPISYWNVAWENETK